MPSPPEPSFAASGAAQLAYEVTGEGPPVLLVHAGVNDRRSWGPLVARLADDHTCIRYDQRGFGDTTYEPEPHSQVDDALAVLDAAGVGGPAAIVGCSMGGRAVVDLALAQPDRVDRLVLIGAAIRGYPWPDDDPESSEPLASLLGAAEEAGDLDEVNRLETWFWLDGPTAPEGRVQGRARELFLDMNARALAAPPAGDEVDLPSAWDRLADLAVPTLVLVGDLDAEDIQDVAAATAERIPGATFECLEGTAHVPHLEAHPRALRVIEDFLSR